MMTACLQWSILGAGIAAASGLTYHPIHSPVLRPHLTFDDAAPVAREPDAKPVVGEKAGEGCGACAQSCHLAKSRSGKLRMQDIDIETDRSSTDAQLYIPNDNANLAASKKPANVDAAATAVAEILEDVKKRKSAEQQQAQQEGASRARAAKFEALSRKFDKARGDDVYSLGDELEALSLSHTHIHTHTTTR